MKLNLSFKPPLMTNQILLWLFTRLTVVSLNIIWRIVVCVRWTSWVEVCLFVCVVCEMWQSVCLRQSTLLCLKQAVGTSCILTTLSCHYPISHTVYNHYISKGDSTLEKEHLVQGQTIRYFYLFLGVGEVDDFVTKKSCHF